MIHVVHQSFKEFGKGNNHQELVLVTYFSVLGRFDDGMYV